MSGMSSFPGIFLSHSFLIYSRTEDNDFDSTSLPDGLLRRQYSLFIILLSISVFSTHSNVPNRLVTGTTLKVFKLISRFRHAGSSLKILFIIVNTYWILWSSLKSSPPLINKWKSFSLLPWTVIFFGLLIEPKTRIFFLTLAILTFLLAIGSYSKVPSNCPGTSIYWSGL